MAIGPVTLFLSSLHYSAFKFLWFFSCVANCLQTRWREYTIADKGAQPRAVTFPMLQYLNSFLNLTLSVLVRMDITNQRFGSLIQKYKDTKIGLDQIFGQLLLRYLKSCTIPSRITSLQELFNKKTTKITFWLQVNQACMRCWSRFSVLVCFKFYCSWEKKTERKTCQNIQNNITYWYSLQVKLKTGRSLPHSYSVVSSVGSYMLHVTTGFTTARTYFIFVKKKTRFFFFFFFFSLQFTAFIISLPLLQWRISATYRQGWEWSTTQYEGK